MITVNAAFMSEVNRSLIARFKRGITRIEPVYTEIAQVETSTTAQNVYAAVAAIGSMREWVGNRRVEDFSAFDFAIKNRDFEKTMRVRKPHVEDDQFGFYGNIAEQLGDAAARHPDKLVSDLLEAGFTTNGYDGVPFFSALHPNPLAGGSNQSNKGTTALTLASYAAARYQMMALTDAGGEILSITPDLLVVPPALEETALTILKDNPIFVGGVPQNNHWVGTARLLVMKRLTDPNNWYLFDTQNIMKAIIMQMRKRPVFTSLTQLTDENVFKRNEFLYGIDYRGNAGYGLWQTAFGAIV